MTSRLNYAQAAPGVLKAMLGLEKYLATSTLDKGLKLLVVLRASQPTGEITVLASPNASTTIGYYGRFKTLGTLYWENSAGLKAAASIFGAKT